MSSFIPFQLSGFANWFIVNSLSQFRKGFQQSVSETLQKLCICFLSYYFSFDNPMFTNGFHIHYICNTCSLQLISVVQMNDKSTLPLFHFLFCELVEQCYSNHKQDNYLEAIKRCGYDTGFKLYNLICIRKQINERPNSIATLMKNIQFKVFRFLFNYDAFNVYTASSDEAVTPKEHYHVIQDNISVYLTWMPEHLWDTSAFFAGLIQAICHSSGLECKVTSYTKMQTGQNPMTEYQIKISEDQVQRWKENQ